MPLPAHSALPERSPSLTSSSSMSSRSTSPGPFTPALGGHSSDSENHHLKGGNAVLARQQALLERSASGHSLIGNGAGGGSLTRKGSVQSIKNSFSDRFDTTPEKPQWSRGHASALSTGSAASTSFPRTGSIADRYRPQSPESANSTPRQSRVPLSALPNSGSSRPGTPGSSSAPSTPSQRVSRLNSLTSASKPHSSTLFPRDQPSVPSSPTASTTTSAAPAPRDVLFGNSSGSPMTCTRSADSPAPHSPSTSRVRTNSASSLYRAGSIERGASPSLSTPSTPTGYSSVISAAQRGTHRYTRSLDTSPSLDSYSPAPSEMNGHHGGGAGHGRRGLDRLSEHWDQEGPLLDEDEIDPPFSPTPGRVMSPSFASPEIDRQKEMHMPGHIEMHRGRGATGRVVLARKATVSAGGWVLPSNSTKAIDISRHHVVAYEYLSHVAEAQAWLDRELRRDPNYDPDAPEANLSTGGVVEFEQALRNGVALAKLARVFDGKEAVPRIYTAAKLAYAHTDNINYFFKFIRRRNLPETYIFETTDLYNARNIPKVIYCIHALNLFMVAHGEAERMQKIKNLQFSEDQLDATKRGIDHLTMPNFRGLGQEMQIEEEPEPEPEPEPETEEERLERLLAEAEHDLQPFVAQTRGVLARKAFRQKLSQLQRSQRSVPALQAHIRGALVRRTFAAQQKNLATADADNCFSGLQARIRGLLTRNAFWSSIKALDHYDESMGRFQAHARGVVARRQHQRKLRSVDAIAPELIGFQALVRRRLAEQRLLHRIKTLKAQSSTVTNLQAATRGLIARRQVAETRTKLQRRHVVKAVGGLQSLARAALSRQRFIQQHKGFSSVEPEMVGVQTQVRGVLARARYYSWLHHLHRNPLAAVAVQALARGHLARMRHWLRLQHYQQHMRDVVKIQSVFRRKQKAEQYNELTRGNNVQIKTVKNFLHLLQDSDYDYAEELEVEALRRDVIQAIRENQAKEAEVHDLELKIALLVKSKIKYDEELRSRRLGPLGGQTLSHQKRNSVLAANGDPFASTQLDRQTQQRYELYQELFYLLQTKTEYLAKLFHRLLRIDFSERERKDVEHIVLTLYGYVQNAREEYLLLKLLQHAMHLEIMSSNHMGDFIRADMMFIKLLVRYGRSAKEARWFKEILAPLVHHIMEDDSIDLQTDPLVIYKTVIAEEETRTGLVSERPRNVGIRQAISDEQTRAIFTRNLQQLRALAEGFVRAITSSTNQMPQGMRWIAREMYRALRIRFPDEPAEAVTKVVCYFLHYRYINPAIVAPETYNVIEDVLEPRHRRALSEVSKLLNQIAAGRLFETSQDAGTHPLNPLNSYILNASSRFSAWLEDVIDVGDAEEFLHADAYVDHTSGQSTVYISPNEIYFMQRLLYEQLDFIAKPQDRMTSIIRELGQAPAYTTEELSRARQGTIALEISARFDRGDPQAQERAQADALWVSTKRLVLAVLKVQPGDDLLHALEAPVDEEHEDLWYQIRLSETRMLLKQQEAGRPPPPHFEDVARLSFAQLKQFTLDSLVRLEEMGRVSSEDQYQEMLNAIARDIRHKNRKRVQRQLELETMRNNRQTLLAKRDFFDGQLRSFNEYIEQSQATMHKKGKKRLTIPFTNQYFHERSLAKKGIKPKFGSFVYNASKLYDDGVLLSIDQMSTGNFDQVKVVLSCDQVGVFEVEIKYSGVTASAAKVLYNDLLDAQYNGRVQMSIEIAEVNVNLFLYLIHKKFFA